MLLIIHSAKHGIATSFATLPPRNDSIFYKKRAEKLLKDELEKNNFSYTWFETLPVKVQPLDQFASSKFDLVLAIGGDGTIREVIAFMVAKNIKTPLGIIAQGSANLLSQSLAIPVFNVKKAIQFALKEKSQLIDVMQINNKHIGVIAAGIGYDTVIMRGANRSLKRKIGLFAYVYIFLKTFLFYHKHLYKITVDGNRYYVYGKLAMIFNVLSIGKKNIIGQHISPQDGMLNLSVFNPKSILDIPVNVFLFFANREKFAYNKVTSFQGENIVIKCKKNIRIQVDGEVFKGRNLQIKVIPDALNVVFDKKFS